MAGLPADDLPPRAMSSSVSLEERVPDRPLRAIRGLVNDILRAMTREFDRLGSDVGRPSMPPERWLRAQLLQAFYSIRSERLLMEQLEYSLLFRWFVGLERVERAEPFLSDEHFTVDGTLIEARGRARRVSSGRTGPRTATRNATRRR